MRVCRLLGGVIAAAAIAVAGCHDTATQPAPADSAIRFHHSPGHGSGDAFPTIVTFRDAATDNIRSDREVRGGDPLYRGPQYEDGVCGVLADLGNGNDARLSPALNYKRFHKKSCGEPRALVFEWDDPDDGGHLKPMRVDAIFTNIDHVVTVPAGATEFRKGQFNVCNRLIFNPADQWIPNNGSDSLLVSFDDKGTADQTDDTWTVRTQPYPDDKGYCAADGRLWHMPFELTIRLK